MMRPYLKPKEKEEREEGTEKGRKKEKRKERTMCYKGLLISKSTFLSSMILIILNSPMEAVRNQFFKSPILNPGS